MGTTDTALEQTQGVEIALVLAIEGYENLVVSREPAKAAAAWTGTDWDSAIDGLTVRGDITQSYEPFGDPIQAGRLSFIIDGQGGDVLGEAVFDRATDAQTELTADISEISIEIGVQSTANFPSAGTIYIGTERIRYTSKTATAFTFCVRGEYAPFKALTEVSQRFGQLHRIETDDLGVIVPPEVNSKPRHWAGRRCGLWVHRIVAGVWDTRDQARLDFAGRILEITDDPTGATVVLAEDIRADLRNSVVGLGMFRATVDPRVYINDGVTVTVVDASLGDGGGPVSEFNTLSFVASSPGTNEALRGYYDAEQLASTLNEWMGAIFDASNTTVRRTLTSDGDIFSMRFEIDGASPHGGEVILQLKSNGAIWESLGFAPTHSDDDDEVIDTRTRASSVADTQHDITANSRPWALNLRPELRINNQLVSRDLNIQRRAGVWYNNRLTAPEPWRSLFHDVPNWGFARIGDFLGPVEFIDDFTVSVLFRGDMSGVMVENLSLTDDNIVQPNEFGDVVFEQVIALEGPLTDLLRQVIQSSNGSLYNHPVWDKFPRQLAAAIPGELVNTRFDESIDHINGTVGVNSLMLVIEKPISIIDLFGSDLMIRQAFFVFEDGEIQLSTFSSAIAALAHHIFDESSKVTPATQDGDTRIPIRLTTKHLVNNVKLNYGREKLSGENYRNVVDIRDQPSIDAFGSSRPVTLKMRNLFLGQRSTGDVIEKFGKEVSGRILPLFGRPIPQIELPISFNHFHAVPGDTCSITDSHARNPDNGKRGIAAMCGTVMSISHSWGGNGENWSGKVNVLLFDRDRFAAYSPAARVDSTENSGTFSAGYDAANDMLAVRTNEYSNILRSDASSFEEGDEVQVIEVDPVAEPQSWNVALLSVSGDQFELDTTLTGWDPAKQYRVVAQSFDSIQSEQAVHAFLASRGDGLILDSKKANEFSLYAAPPRRRDGQGAAILSALSQDDLREFIPPAALGDGAPATPALDSALARVSNALVTSITAPSMPTIRSYEVRVPGTFIAAGMYLFDIIPFFIGRGGMAQRPGYYRPLFFRPVFKSGTVAESALLRVRTATSRPKDSNGLLANVDVQIREPSSTGVQLTTASTALVSSTVSKLIPAYRPTTGLTYIIVEGRYEPGLYDTVYRGAAELRVGEPELLP